MKKFKFYGFASALLLASAAGLSSCSSDSDVTGGTTGVAGQVVKTQFAINIPYAKGSDNNNAKATTRMTEHNTQADVKSPTDFLGIVDLHLLAFNNEPTTGNENAESNIEVASGDADVSSKDAWRTVYSDVAIPQETKHFVFYAQAGKESNTSDAQSGVLNTPPSSTIKLEDLSFGLKTIYTPNVNTTLADESDAKTIIQYLNQIANSSIDNYTASDGKTYTVKWSEVSKKLNTEGETDIYYRGQTEREHLAALYTKFTSLTAGSAPSCIKTIESLKTQLGDDTQATGLIQKIKDNIAAANYALSGNTFPEKLGLPDGVAKVKFQNGAFSYITDGTLLGEGKINTSFIAYPARLTYYASSAIMVSDQKITNVNSLPTYADWIKDPSSVSWGNDLKEGSVVASTRSVVLKEPIKYSVANLKLTAKCGGATLEDASESDQKNITVPTAGFPITGVLVGGQPGAVNWKFEPSSNEDFKYTIYDTDMNKTKTQDGSEVAFCAKQENTASTTNYTLVLDNKKATGDQDDVYITIELKNTTGTDFVGKDGIVPNGAKFYLVGKLSKPTVSETQTIDHIFVKDHTTEVNLNITNLKNAYNCIPDLRSSQISLGLAVDLTWKTGLKYDITIGE